MKEKPELGEDNSGCHTGAGSGRITGNTEVKLKMELSNSHFADDSERATALQDTKQERRPPLSSVRGMLLGPTRTARATIIAR